MVWLLFNVVSDPDAPQLAPGMLIETARAVGFGDTEEFELLPGITRVVIAKKGATERHRPTARTRGKK
jgi:hypothetical protein